MEFTFKKHQLPEMQLHLLVEACVTQQAFLKLFLKYNCESEEQAGEMLNFYNQEYESECSVIRYHLPNYELNLLVEAYAAQQALSSTFIKYSCETNKQVTEMLDFFKKTYESECSVIKENLFAEFGSVDLTDQNIDLSL